MTEPAADVYPEDPCQDGVLWDPESPFDAFEDTKRPMDKTRLIKWLTYCPQGAPVARCVKAVLPSCDTKEIAERSYSNTDYKFAKRFFDRTEYAELTSDSDVVTACPTPSAFHLTARKQNSKYSDAAYAKDRAEAYARQIRRVDDVKDAEFLTKQFSKYLRSIENKRLMLREEVEQDKMLTLPYATRFTSDHRKDAQWAKYHGAWETATESYDTGLLLTLTTDPKRYDSLLDMLNGLMEGWNNLLETLNDRHDGDGRLDFIRALEFTGSDDSNWPGLPHLHIVVFGTRYIDHDWLSNYWSTNADHAEIVHVDPMNDRGSNDWTANMEDGTKLNAQAYLGKYLSEVLDATEELTGGDLLDHADDWCRCGCQEFRESASWKLALYWLSGRQFWDCSHALKPDTKPDTLQDVDGIGETKLDRLADAGIKTLSDVRLASEDEIASIDGISTDFAADLKELVGQPSQFDVYNFEFVGASEPSEMPSAWSMDARHIGTGVG